MVCKHAKVAFFFNKAKKKNAKNPPHWILIFLVNGVHAKW